MKIFKKVAIVVLIVLLAISIKAVCNASTVTVTTETLKIRKGPSTDTVILGLLSIGNKVEYLAEEDGWYKIKSGDIIGYISKEFSKLEGETTPNTNTEANNTQTNMTQDEPTTNKPEESTKPEENTNKENLLGEKKLKSDSKVYILPLINSDVLAELKKGEEITVVSIVNNWAYVQTEKIDAWVMKKNIESESTGTTTPPTDTKPDNTTDTKIEETTYETSKTMYVNEPSIYVRSGAGTENKVVDSLTLNMGVTVIGESADWYKVKLADKTGYVAKRLLSTQKQEATSRGTEVERTEPVVTQTSKGQEVVEYAKQYLGKKYVYGGSGPNTFDCSGYTMYVYKKFGINLTHSATAQSKVGTYVAKEDLQPGDLVFFTDYETGYGIGHCGIYVGEGNFIHASSGTGYCVKISTLLSGSYDKRYETARRVL